MRHLGRPTSPLRVVPHRGLIPWLARYLAASVPGRAEANDGLLHRLGTQSSARWLELSESGLVDGVNRRGILYAYYSESAFDEAVAHTKRHATSRHGAEVFHGRAAREVVPTLSATIHGGLYFADEWHADPRVLTESLGRAAVDAGARLRTESSVTSIRRKAPKTLEVAISLDAIQSRHVVVAAGVGTRALTRGRGVKLPGLPDAGTPLTCPGHLRSTYPCCCTKSVWLQLRWTGARDWPERSSLWG